MDIVLHERVGQILKELHVALLHYKKADELIVNVKYRLEDILLREHGPPETDRSCLSIYGGPLDDKAEPDRYPDSHRKQEIIQSVYEVKSVLLDNYSFAYIQHIVRQLDEVKDLIDSWPEKIRGVA